MWGIPSECIFIVGDTQSSLSRVHRRHKGRTKCKMADKIQFFLLSLTLFTISSKFGYANKYSMEVNKEDPLRDINAPFRMQKVNLVWQKALKVSTR